MKIDVYAHICPKKFIDEFSQRVVNPDKLPFGVDRLNIRTLWDVNERLEIMDRFEDLAHVLVPTGPAVETWCTPEVAAELAKVFNDAMAEIVNKYPDKFLGAVACLPLNNMDATLKEIDRAITQLGFRGILLNTPIFENGYNYETKKPLYLPAFWPIYESIAKHNLPIWIHPRGSGGVPAYTGEDRGKWGMAHCFGWPMETVMAMGTLIGSGVLAKYPNLKIITHHCGGGMVPALSGRIAGDIVTQMMRGSEGEKGPLGRRLPVDYFRMFYADTALYGDMHGLMCGYAFFGVDHMLFGTDFPYDFEDGDKYTRQTINAVYRMDISDADKEKIFQGNARRILRL